MRSYYLYYVRIAYTGLTEAEQEKVTILALAIKGKITNTQAAKQLRLSIRQVQRAKAAIRKNGIISVARGLKGKPGNHRIAENIFKFKDKYLKALILPEKPKKVCRQQVILTIHPLNWKP